jgi:hypothetical protein
MAKIIFNNKNYNIDESALATAMSALEEHLRSMAGGNVPDQELGVDPVTGEILDSWDYIIASINNNTYATKYSVGNYKPLDLGSEGVVNMQIAAIDADVISDDSGNAHITWVAKELLATPHYMNSTSTSANGWGACEMRGYLQNDILALMDSNIQNAIVAVDKNYYDYTTKSVLISSDKLWIPSFHEVGLEFGNITDSCAVYSGLFTGDSASLIKYCNGVASSWWLRSGDPRSSTAFRYIDANGNHLGSGASASWGIALCFCM